MQNYPIALGDFRRRDDEERARELRAALAERRRGSARAARRPRRRGAPRPRRGSAPSRSPCRRSRPTGRSSARPPEAEAEAPAHTVGIARMPPPTMLPATRAAALTPSVAASSAEPKTLVVLGWGLLDRLGIQPDARGRGTFVGAAHWALTNFWIRRWAVFCLYSVSAVVCKEITFWNIRRLTRQ